MSIDVLAKESESLWARAMLWKNKCYQSEKLKAKNPGYSIMENYGTFHNKEIIFFFKSFKP